MFQSRVCTQRLEDREHLKLLGKQHGVYVIKVKLIAEFLNSAVN